MFGGEGAGGYEYNGGGDDYGGYGGYGGFGGMDMMGGTAFGGMGTNAPSSGGKNEQNKFHDSLTPATIKQLYDATKNNPNDDGVQIDNNPVKTVVIMGIVQSCSHHSTNVEYMINDGTGSMRCSKYLDEGSHVSYPGEKEFVKVFGRLKKFSGDSWSVSIYHVAKVTDMNEISHHLLEVMYTHLQRTKGPISSLGGIGSARPVAVSTPGFKQQIVNTSNSSNKLAEQILDILKTAEDESTGMHVSEVIHLMKARNGIDITQQKLVKELDTLSNSGSVYTTIDDEHYLPS